MLIDGSLYLSTKKHPQNFHFIQSKTTRLHVAAQDLTHNSRPWLEKKIDQAVHYQGSISDHEVLGALGRLNNNESPTMTLALFLYLMDEVSRRPNPEGITFLTACKMAGLDKAKPKKTKEKFIKTLEILGIYDQNIPEIVEDWCKGGGFKINGQIQDRVPVAGKNGFYESVGAYVRLAENISRPNLKNPYLQISECVSFALGHKICMRDFKDSWEGAYNHVSGMVDKSPKLSMQEISRYIKKGTAIRKQRVLSLIKESFANEEPRAMDREAKNFFIDLLAGVPTAALRVLHAEGYSIACTEDGDLSNLLPERRFNNKADREAYEITKSSIGARHSRYKLIYMGLGTEIEQLHEARMMAARRTVCHETVHVLINADKIRNDEELHGKLDSKGRFKGKTKGKILQLKDELYQFFKSMNEEKQAEFTKILRDPLDSKSELIKFISPKKLSQTFKYNLNEDRYFCNDAKEEVLANLYMIWETEPHLFLGDNPSLPKLREIAGKLEALVEEIANKLDVPPPLLQAGSKRKNIIERKLASESSAARL